MAPANPAQGTPQRLPLYNLGDHDASLEVHSQAIDGSRRDHVVDRRTSDAWKERLRKESQKSYRQRINENNEYLGSLSENHDIPKVASAGLG